MNGVSHRKDGDAAVISLDEHRPHHQLDYAIGKALHPELGPHDPSGA